MFQGSGQHNGQAAGVGPSTPTVAWSYLVSDGHSGSRTGPLIGADGTVYVEIVADPFMSPDQTSTIEAFTPKGALLWKWSDHEDIANSTPAIDGDGNLYVTSLSGHLIAVGPDGVTKWKLGGDPGPDFYDSPTLGADGTIYVQDPTALYAIRSADGATRWQSPAPYDQGGTTLSPDGAVVYVTSGTEIVALDVNDGTTRWRAAIPPAPSACAPSEGPERVSGPAAVAHDGNIYVSVQGPPVSGGWCGGDVAAFAPDGSLKWDHHGSAAFLSTPAVTDAGLVVAGDRAGQLEALSASDGRQVWSYQVSRATDNIFVGSPIVDRDGTIYVQNGANSVSYFPELVLAIRDGILLWQAQVANCGSPALSNDGTLYVAGSGGVTAYAG